jgi:HK97 family phage major capsid protein
MKWQTLVSALKGMDPPYAGDSDDFDAVQAYMAKNGHSTEEIESDGQVFSLEQLYDNRPGKRVVIDGAATKDALKDEVLSELKSEMAESGLRGNKSTFKHDVKVGKNRLADDPKGGFKHFGEVVGDVIQAGIEKSMSDRLVNWQKAALTTYGNETVGSDGGFTVPTDFANNILTRVMGEESPLSRTDMYRVQGNGQVFPYDDDEPWNSSGIQAEWQGEAGSHTQRKPLLQQKELRLRKLITLVPLTDELMADSVAVGQYVSRKAADVIDFKVGEAVFRGTGAAQPLGFLNSAGTIEVAKEGSQVADTLIFPNVVKMWSRMYAPYRSRAVWFVSQTVEPELMQMAIPGRTATGAVTTNFGTGGVYLPAGTAGGSPFATLFGRPVIVTQHCEELGDKGDICLVALDQYVAITKGSGIESATSMHLWFDQDVQALKFRMRLDGQPWSNTTITPRDSDSSAKTLSAFVTLAARG